MEISYEDTAQTVKWAILGFWGTIWASYTWGLLDGDIQSPISKDEFYWPMISDTWVSLPGKILSRLLLPPFIYMLAFYCWKISNWMDSVTWDRYVYSYNSLSKYINKSNRYLTQTGLLSFLLCIAVNEADNDALHSVAAFYFFITQCIFFLIITGQLIIHKDIAYNRTSIIIKGCLSLSFLSLLIAIAVMSSYHQWNIYKVRVAVSEWFAVTMLTLFHWFMRWELTSGGDDYRFDYLE